jgi:1-pyrroline-5-carboxylate dehydrogenase
MVEDMGKLKMGMPEELSTFTTAVIDQPSFKKISSYIDLAKNDSSIKVLAGGSCDDRYAAGHGREAIIFPTFVTDRTSILLSHQISSAGYNIQPTFVEVADPHHRLMQEEIFGPVVAAYVYDDE